MRKRMNGTITDVRGIRAGHATDEAGLTGCTAVLCEGGAVGGVDQRGGAPGTRETDLLRPMHLVQKVHGVVLAGGSAVGLAAADGVMRYLAERKTGAALAGRLCRLSQRRSSLTWGWAGRTRIRMQTW